MLLNWEQNKLQGDTPLEEYVKNIHTDRLQIGSTMAVESGQLGCYESTFISIFYAYTPDFSQQYISEIGTGNSVCETCTISYLKFKVIST